MTNKYAFIIPAQEHNQYFDSGDLCQFGGTTLLEWKISQIKALHSDYKIYVTTPSEEIANLVKDEGVSVINRPSDLEFSELVQHTAENVSEEYLIWSNPTSPFISEADYKKMITAFEKHCEEGGDSLVSGVHHKEYTYYNNETLNFSATEFETRTNLESVFIVTNGCYIRKRTDVHKTKSLFGNSPHLYHLSDIASKEIKELSDVVICNDMIAIYLKRKDCI